LDPEEKGKVCEIRRARHLGGIYGYSSVAGETTQREATASPHTVKAGRIVLVIIGGLEPVG
jgi:hypothetical protein